MLTSFLHTFLALPLLQSRTFVISIRLLLTTRTSPTSQQLESLLPRLTSPLLPTLRRVRHSFFTNHTLSFSHQPRKTARTEQSPFPERCWPSKKTMLAVAAHVYVLGIPTKLSAQSTIQRSNMNDLPLLHFLVLSLATFRLSRLFTTDVIFEPLREKIWKRFPPSTQFGYLFTCNWCMSIWFGSLVTISYTIVPSITFVASLPLALSALAGLISTRLDN